MQVSTLHTPSRNTQMTAFYGCIIHLHIGPVYALFIGVNYTPKYKNSASFLRNKAYVGYLGNNKDHRLFTDLYSRIPKIHDQ